MLAKGTNKMIILLIGSLMNRLRNFTLSHNEISTAKTDHKNEISTKNWVGRGCKKSTLLVKVNAKSQLWSTEKSTVNAKADVALC